MGDLDNLRKRYAQEEATLAATHKQIETAQRQIETLHQKIQATQSQIETAKEHIEELKGRTETIQRRMALLKEYLEMVESSAEVGEPPAAATAHEGSEPAAATPQAAAAPSNPDPTPVEAEPLDDIDLMPPAPAAEAADPVPEEAVPVTFETMNDEFFTDELLPRTGSFGEELILLLAHGGKALTPKSIVRAFKRLDYTPKVAPSEDAIRGQIESENLFFVSSAGGRIALTDEGEEEAQKLLERLLE